MKSYLFFEIFNISLKASIVILIVLFIRYLLKKTPKIYSYALWIVVLFRLLCPVSIEFPISFIPEKISNGIALQSITDSFVGEHEVYWDSTEEYNEAIQQGIKPVIVPEKDTGHAGAYVVTDTDGVSEAKTIFNQWFPIMFYIWLVGILAFVCFHVTTYIGLKRRLIGCVPYSDTEDIYISDYIDTPFVIGFFYPCIYLPSALTGQDLQYVLAHERHHIRRKDHILKACALMVSCIHWFNPLVWMAFILMCRDMETSCDEAVLKNLGNDIGADYSTALLNVTVGKDRFSGITIAFDEGDVKHRIKNILQWKKPSLKLVVISVTVCVVTIILCAVNPSNTLIGNPYEWSHSVSVEDIDSHSAFRWGEESVEYYLSKTDIKDLVYALNDVLWKEFEQGNAIVDNEFTVVLQCGRKEYLLTYGSGETMISFENNDKGNRGVWKTDNPTLAKSMKRIMNESLQVAITEQKTPIQPTKEEVLKIRKKVLAGMSEGEIRQLTKLVHKGNHVGESDYLPANDFSRYANPKSLDWKLFTDSGEVIIGYAFESNVPPYGQVSGMTEEEYNEKYGTPVAVSDNVPIRDKFYAYLEKIENLLKTHLLDDDLNEMKRYMELAVDTHDVKYLHEIYYKLHDLDYYLFQYGPEDVSPEVAYASSIAIFYGRLQVYEGALPTVTEAYNLADKSFYKMSDGMFRMGLHSYKYKLELSGHAKGQDKDVHFVVLSNDKNLSFEEVLDSSVGEELPVDEAAIVFSF